MPRFRKKPVEIEAVQVTAADFNGSSWDGSPFSACPEWLEHAINAHKILPRGVDADYAVFDIVTLEGTMTASPGDWIIRGVKGELYPCKPDIFAAIYEPVDDSESFASIKERARS